MVSGSLLLPWGWRMVHGDLNSSASGQERSRRDRHARPVRFLKTANCGMFEWPLGEAGSFRRQWVGARANRRGRCARSWRRVMPAGVCETSGPIERWLWCQLSLTRAWYAPTPGFRPISNTPWKNLETSTRTVFVPKWSVVLVTS